MDASDEERLRQLMLGSDSEDELDATPAVPAPPAPAPAAAEPAASAFDFMNAPAAASETAPPAPAARVETAPPPAPAAPATAGLRTDKPLLDLSTARDALRTDAPAPASSAFDFLNAAPPPAPPPTQQAPPPPPAPNPFDSPEQPKTPPKTAAALGLEEEADEDELDFTPTKDTDGDEALARAIQASLDDAGAMTFGDGPIGLRVKLEKGRLRVVGVKGAAEAKGIRVNDIIESVNGEALMNVSEAAFAEKLRKRPAALAVSRPPVQQQPRKKKREPVRKPLSWGSSIDARKCSLDGVRAFARPFPVGAPWSKAEAIIEAVLVGRGFVRRKDWPAQSALGADLFLADRCGGGGSLIAGSGASDGKRCLVIGALAQQSWEAKADDSVFQALMSVRDALQKETFESDGLDDGFLRDLQREAAVKLERRLVDAARPLDAKAKKAEVDAARVAIALQPAYASAGVKPPQPSRAPPLASYPLELETEPVSTYPDGGVSSLREAGNNVTPLLELRAGKEYVARVGRKEKSVQARVENALQSSKAIVGALVQRRRRNLPPSPLETALAEKFRTASQDAFLYACRAMIITETAPKGGTLTVTSDALYFSSAGIAGFGAVAQVLPYKAMRAVDVTSGSGFTERLVAKGASVLATEAPSTLVVEDVSGNSQRFVVPPTPLVDAHADLVLQIVTIARALPAHSPEPSRRVSIDNALPQPPTGGSLRDFLAASRTSGSSSDPRSALTPAERRASGGPTFL